VDDISFVATMIPMIIGMLPAFQQVDILTEQEEGLWWALEVGSVWEEMKSYENS
jgi:hypothetical protein